MLENKNKIRRDRVGREKEERDKREGEKGEERRKGEGRRKRRGICVYPNETFCTFTQFVAIAVRASFVSNLHDDKLIRVKLGQCCVSCLTASSVTFLHSCCGVCICAYECECVCGSHEVKRKEEQEKKTKRRRKEGTETEGE